MNRRQLAFLIVINALISLTIALSVAWVIEARRPDLEELAARYTPPAAVVAGPSQENPAPPANAADPPAEGDAAPSVEPTPEPAGAVAEEVSAEDEVYVVQAGDSLGAIAGRFGVTVAAIVEANNLANPDFVFSGQRLIIPAREGSGNAPPPVEPTQAPGAGIRISALETPGNLLSEAVLIVNDSNLAVNLQGWRLEREGGPAYAIESVTLFPGSSLWIHSRAGTNTSVALYWGQTSPVWQSGAAARLVSPQGEVVTSYPVP
ncbi:MAG: LysM peptidoglycan-binding domain-containing protein [Caldilineaceae bacterium]|nr:LysM peptidoglycan-binding domain-containing protein [Caldilineaceae bacterium]